MILHPKIKALKQRASVINYRAISVNEFGELKNTYAENLEKGIVEGYALQHSAPNSYRELFLKGSFDKSINENGPGTNSNYEIKFLNQHDQKDTLSLFELLEDNDIGLRFKTVPLDERDIEGSSAASVLRKLQKRTLNNFSIGFDYVWNRMEYDDKLDAIVIKEAKLYEISVVSVPSDMNTFAYRSIDDLEELYDEAEELISKMPRTLRAEARQIFARHKSLMQFAPFAGRQTPDDAAPIGTALDYDYLLNNFKL